MSGTEDLAGLDERHLRMLRAAQARALQEISGAPPGGAGPACRLLIAAVQAERTVLAVKAARQQRVTLAQLLAYGVERPGLGSEAVTC